jgi:hypothetical protein
MNDESLAAAAQIDQLPEWCNVYAGLSDDQIANLERAILRRMELTRSDNVQSIEPHV